MKSLGRSAYISIFIDDYRRMKFAYSLNREAEVEHGIRDFFESAERQTDDRLKHLRSDSGVEYGFQRLLNNIRQIGIVFKKTDPYTPQQNRVTKRKNSFVLNRARAMMQGITAPTRFGAEALSTAVHVQNLTPSSGLP